MRRPDDKGTHIDTHGQVRYKSDACTNITRTNKRIGVIVCSFFGWCQHQLCSSFFLFFFSWSFAFSQFCNFCLFCLFILLWAEDEIFLFHLFPSLFLFFVLSIFCFSISFFFISFLFLLYFLFLWFISSFSFFLLEFVFCLSFLHSYPNVFVCFSFFLWIPSHKNLDIYA